MTLANLTLLAWRVQEARTTLALPLRAFVSDTSAQRDAVCDFEEDAYVSGVPAVLRLHRALWSCFVSLADFAGWVVEPDGAVAGFKRSKELISRDG